MNRSARRKAAKLAKKSGNEDLEKKLSMVSSLSDSCLTCQKAFDKSNIEMLDSWIIVVRDEETRLYCPTCWDDAMKRVQQIENTT